MQVDVHFKHDLYFKIQNASHFLLIFCFLFFLIDDAYVYISFYVIFTVCMQCSLSLSRMGQLMLPCFKTQVDMYLNMSQLTFFFFFNYFFLFF